MADLLPSTPDVSGPDSDEARVVGVDSDDADELLSALSSRTARQVLSELHDEPAAPAALADRVDTSLQNVQYHLGRLEDAGLVEVADTAYSEKGREMKVYAPVDRALVVVATREEETTGLKATLKRLLGGVGILGVASLVVDRLLGGPTASVGFSASSGSGAPSPSLGGHGSGGGASSGSGSGSASGAASTNATTSAGGTAPAGTSSTHAAGSSSTQLSTTGVEHSTTPTATTSVSASGSATSATTGTSATSTSVASATTGTSTASATSATTSTSAASTSGGSNMTFVGQTAGPSVHGVHTTPVPSSMGHAGTPYATTVMNSVAASPGVVFFLGGLTALLLLFLLVRRHS